MFSPGLIKSRGGVGVKKTIFVFISNYSQPNSCLISSSGAVEWFRFEAVERFRRLRRTDFLTHRTTRFRAMFPAKASAVVDREEVLTNRLGAPVQESREENHDG